MTDRIELPGTNPPERTGHDQSYSLSSFRARTADSAAPNSAANRVAAASSTEAAARTTSTDRSGDCRNSSSHSWNGNIRAQPSGKARTRNSKVIPSDLSAMRTSSGRLISRCLLVGFGRWAVGRPQVGPIDVRAKLFATDLSASRALDGRTVLGRNVATAHPVVYNLLHNVKPPGQLSLASNDTNRSFQMFHGTHYKHVGIIRQHVVFDQINICFSVPPWR